MADSGWRTISTDVAYKDNWFQVDVDTVELPDGKKEKFTMVRADLPTGHCVGIIPFFSANNILLVKQYRYRHKTLCWEIPSGVVKRNETFCEAAARELKEETGYNPGKLSPLITYNPNMSIVQTAHLFTAENLVKEISCEHDEGEFILETKSFTLHEALRMVKEGKIKDSLSIIGLLLSYLRQDERFTS